MGRPGIAFAGASGSTAGASASASGAAPAPPSSSDASKALPPRPPSPKRGSESLRRQSKRGTRLTWRTICRGRWPRTKRQCKPTRPTLTVIISGEAQLASGNLADANNSFADGIRNAGSRDDLHAKLLFVIADLREREGKWPEAKKAWEEYGQFQSSHPSAKGYAITATERMKMIDTHVDLATKYGAVKQRIEQRVKETTAPAPDDGPQGPIKKK